VCGVEAAAQLGASPSCGPLSHRVPLCGRRKASKTIAADEMRRRQESQLKTEAMKRVASALPSVPIGWRCFCPAIEAANMEIEEENVALTKWVRREGQDAAGCLRRVHRGGGISEPQWPQGRFAAHSVFLRRWSVFSS